MVPGWARRANSCHERRRAPHDGGSPVQVLPRLPHHDLSGMQCQADHQVFTGREPHCRLAQTLL